MKAFTGGLIGDLTCRALARISVDANLNGQWNPSDQSFMLARGEGKKFVLRVTLFLIFFIPVIIYAQILAVIG